MFDIIIKVMFDTGAKNKSLTSEQKKKKKWFDIRAKKARRIQNYVTDVLCYARSFRW